MKHLLFICSQNRHRSPTAERVFGGYVGIKAASAGIDRGATNPVTLELLQWAHYIFVMEKRHRNRLSSNFRHHLHDKRVICLNIPDEYEFMDPLLVKLLKVRVSRFLTSQ